MNKKQAKEALGQMLEEGLWLSPTIIHDFNEALDRLYRRHGHDHTINPEDESAE